jgi:aminopeptidase-like protein
MADQQNQPSRRALDMYELMAELYPVCRSITGDGVRQTLAILGRHVPLQVSEVPSGTDVLDWTVPNEWNIRGGWIQTLGGQRVLDFENHNLHVLNYSTPIQRRISREELDAHLYSIPERPDWIPYRTSYYAERWGFCLTERQRQALTDAEYDICIDSSLAPGHLTYAECAVPGQTSEEILLTAHTCHPSLCNDNLSGIAVATFLLKELMALPPQRYTVRVLFIPGTIGSICWLARNREAALRIKHGMSLVCLGDDSPFAYKRTLHGILIVSWLTRSRDRGAHISSSTISRTVTTSASSTRRVSLCPLAPSCGANTESSLSTTPPPTTSSSSPQVAWKSRSSSVGPPLAC